jgi:hypothetical protein
VFKCWLFIWEVNVKIVVERALMDSLSEVGVWSSGGGQRARSKLSLSLFHQDNIPQYFTLFYHRAANTGNIFTQLIYSECTFHLVPGPSLYIVTNWACSFGSHSNCTSNYDTWYSVIMTIIMIEMVCQNKFNYSFLWVNIVSGYPAMSQSKSRGLYPVVNLISSTVKIVIQSLF